MLLELSTPEARELKQSLESVLQLLLEELAHAQQHALRDVLQERIERLEQIRRRLELSVEGESVYA